jgi:hypothetical protein
LGTVKRNGCTSYSSGWGIIATEGTINGYQTVARETLGCTFIGLFNYTGRKEGEQDRIKKGRKCERSGRNRHELEKNKYMKQKDKTKRLTNEE